MDRVVAIPFTHQSFLRCAHFRIDRLAQEEEATARRKQLEAELKRQKVRTP